MHQAASRQPETALSVVDTGGSQAAPVVLLHGAFRHAEDWEHQIAALRRESRVIAVDLPCHGRSGRRQHGCTVQGAAEDVRLTLAELEVSEAILVGHSFSCPVVAEMGRRWPELASGLVLVDGSRTADALTPSSSIIERMRQEGAAATLRSRFENMFVPTSPAELVTA
jgi:pimeloyl-ACP methyl ester carboxylesterase